MVPCLPAQKEGKMRIHTHISMHILIENEAHLEITVVGLWKALTEG
jgi:hypothetical protein